MMGKSLKQIEWHLWIMKKFILIILFFLFVFNIEGCSTTRRFYTPNPYITKTGQLGIVGAAGGAAIGAYAGGGLGAGLGGILGGMIGVTVGHFLQQNQTLVQRIEDQGVKVVTVGDNVLLILPADKFFQPDSPNRIQMSDTTLNDIAGLLRGYEKVTVKVAAYSDTTCSPQRALALTQQQAQNVVDYLWARGIDTRIIFAKGYGSGHPISNNWSAYGRAQNRRIEITLRLLPKCCVLSTGTG